MSQALLMCAVGGMGVLLGVSVSSLSLWYMDQKWTKQIQQTVILDSMFTRDEKRQISSLLKRMANLKVTNQARFNRLLICFFDKLKNMEQEK